MAKVQTSVELPASPEKVWEVATDLDRYGEWLEIHLGWPGDVAPTEISKGSTFKEKIGMMNMPNTIEWTVDEYEPPSKVAMSGTGMAGVKVSMSMEVTPTATGASLTLSSEFTGQLIVGALATALEKNGKAAVERSLEKFAALLG